MQRRNDVKRGRKGSINQSLPTASLKRKGKLKLKCFAPSVEDATKASKCKKLKAMAERAGF